MSSAAAIFVAPKLLPLVYPTAADALVASMADQIKARQISPEKLALLRAKYSLDWLYISDRQGKPESAYIALAPTMVDWSAENRRLDYRGENLYETIYPLRSGRYLHAAVSLDAPIAAPDLTDNPIICFIQPVRGAFPMVVLVLIFVFAAGQLSLFYFVVRPLFVINAAITRMVASGKFSSRDFAGIDLSSSIASEVADVRQSIRAIFVHFEKQLLELSARDEKKDKWKLKNLNEAPEPVTAPSPFAPPKALADDGGIDSLLAARNSCKNYAETMTASLANSLRGVVDGLVFLQEGSEDRAGGAVLSALGPNIQWANQLAGDHLDKLLSEVRLSAKVASLGPLSLKRLGLQEIFFGAASRHLIVAPVVHNRRPIAYWLLSAPAPLSAETISLIEQFCHKSAEKYFGLLLQEDSEAQKWTDAVTHLRNESYLIEYLEHLATSVVERPQLQFAVYCFCYDSEGEAEDKMQTIFVQTAAVLRQVLEGQKKKDLIRRVPTLRELEATKGKGFEFEVVAVLSGEDSPATLARELCRELAPASGTLVSPPALCIGMANFPIDGHAGKEVLQRARSALYFALENKTGPVTLCASAMVPADFRPMRRLLTMKGDLGILDCGEVLQSIASGSRTGILTIDIDARHRFKMSILNGKPIAASLGKLSGINAIVEVIVMCDSGSFNFQETQVEVDPGQRPVTPLANALMMGALAQDHYQAAQQTLPATSRHVIAGAHASAWIDQVDKNEVSEQELAIMKLLVSRMINRKEATALERVFSDLDDLPTHLKWRSAALLYSYGAIDFL